jgi:hypothetical protein
VREHLSNGVGERFGIAARHHNPGATLEQFNGVREGRCYNGTASGDRVDQYA